MIVPEQVYSNKSNIDNIITKKNINKALVDINIIYTNQKIVEFVKSDYDYKIGFTGVKYDKNELDIANKKLSELIIKHITNYLDKNKQNICNGNCLIKSINNARTI